ncbi:HAMP domain-containing sensor histidine kinase [Streptomyces sp. MP131-18]|uniref:sensor histidine kinase n=1 Tax=Streptomyces sp. MP131-18 TaxID=1857892 RepID=UPI00097BF9AD|nr:HAMP domain-containing sensor histidine kinase [Streptomyces sp. MP131-18]ONK10782.1 Signal transduction histidine-protein kinase BaeS [Streptomyces sp. MP131-18]
MRSRLLPLLIVLLAGVLLALGIPLATSQARSEQQRVVVDRIDDTTRFASLTQFVTDGEVGGVGDARLSTLRDELAAYHDVYGIRAGVFRRDGSAMAVAPAGWEAPGGVRGQEFNEALAGRRSQGPPQVWPWQKGRRLVVASPVIRDGDVIAVVVIDSPTEALCSRIVRGWAGIAAGEAGAMLLAVAVAFRLTGWVLRPVRVLDKATHDIATGRLTARVAPAGGPPELRRLARSFNEMADNVEDVLERQRAFVADASHQLRNPLAALLLRIDLLALELPDGNAEVASVRNEGKRLARVLDGLLDLALAEGTAADLRTTDVAALVAERVAAWRPVADRKDVRLLLAGPAAVTGWADPVGLSSALDAIVDNALKFTPSGGEVRVRVIAARDEVTVVTADDGPGLDEAELERIGDRFWRSGRHQNVSGSGLGLSIVAALLAAAGAGVSYARNRPHGLKVTVSVPRHAPEENGPPGVSPQALPAAGDT